jgi:hypothetical protein
MIYTKIQEESKDGWSDPASYRVLVISDWHLDLHYTVGARIFDCGSCMCCSKLSGTAKPGLGARKYGEVAFCDIPEITAREQMEWLKENLRGHLKPSLILWTGDSTSHEMVETSEEHVIQTI